MKSGRSQADMMSWLPTLNFFPILQLIWLCKKFAFKWIIWNDKNHQLSTFLDWRAVRIELFRLLAASSLLIGTKKRSKYAKRKQMSHNYISYLECIESSDKVCNAFGVVVVSNSQHRRTCWRFTKHSWTLSKHWLLHSITFVQHTKL